MSLEGHHLNKLNFRGEGGDQGGGGDQGRCELRSEVFVKIQKKNFFFFFFLGGGGGLVGEVGAVMVDV